MLFRLLRYLLFSTLLQNKDVAKLVPPRAAENVGEFPPRGGGGARQELVHNVVRADL